MGASQDSGRLVSEVHADEVRTLLLVLLGEADAPDGATVQSLEAYQAELDASAQMNFGRWKVLNHSSREMKTGATYDENIEYLKDWIRDRMSVLDEAWGIE